MSFKCINRIRIHRSVRQQVPLIHNTTEAIFLSYYLSSNRQHYHFDVCLEDNREDYYNYHYVNYICTHMMEFLQF